MDKTTIKFQIKLYLWGLLSVRATLSLAGWSGSSLLKGTVLLEMGLQCTFKARLHMRFVSTSLKFFAAANSGRYCCVRFLKNPANLHEV